MPPFWLETTEGFGRLFYGCAVRVDEIDIMVCYVSKAALKCHAWLMRTE